MSVAPINLLLVEDNSSDAALLEESLTQASPGQFRITRVDRLAGVVVQLNHGKFDLMLLDLSLPDSAGSETLMRARAAAPDVPIVVLTGAAGEDDLEAGAMRLGAQDYFLKGSTDGAQLCRAIQHAIERQRLQRELQRTKDELESRVAKRTSALQQTVQSLQQEIVSRKHAEQALRESEGRYRALFEAAPVGLGISRYQGEVITFNRALCNLMGVKPEEAPRLRAPDFHLPGQRAELLAELRKHGRIEQREAVLKRPDGSTLLGLLNMQEVRLGEESVLLSIVQDITRQKQSEWHIEGVRELLELFATRSTRQEYVDAVVRLLSEWSGCRCAGIRLATADGRLPYVACLGYSRSFLSRENCLSLDGSDCPCARLFSGRSRTNDLPFTTRRGSFFCNHAGRFAQQFCAEPVKRAYLACLESGYDSLAHTPILYRGQLMGTLHLADPRKDQFPPETVSFLESIAPLIGEALHRFEVEERLAESEERFRTMFERHDTPMLLVDPRQRVIVDANPAAATLYGYDRNRLRGMQIEDLCAASGELGGSRQWTCQTSRGGEAHSHRLANGELRTVEVHSSPIQLKGRQLLFSIVHDVTERRGLEKQILDIGENERHRIGQDLHDSLGGMLSGAALLTKALARRLVAAGNSDAAVAEEIVQCINEAIGQARAISRGLFPVGLSTAGLVAGLRDLAVETGRRSGVTCRVRAGAGIQVEDPTVSSHLFRLVQEALNNAVRHGKPRRVLIRLARRAEALLLEIKDDGKGLPPHRRADRGLGFRTMEYRANAIGAQLSVKSEPGKGTLISCLVPISKLQQPQPA